MQIQRSVETMRERMNGQIAPVKQVARLTSLTEKLVFLSRMDEEAMLEMLEFSLSDAILDTAEPFKG